MLARLAELDVLRSVEVLSTVSGGSIVGALYYLEVQDLLQTRGYETFRATTTSRSCDVCRTDFLAGFDATSARGALANLMDNFDSRVSAPATLAARRMGDLYDASCSAGSQIGRRPRTARRKYDNCSEPADSKILKQA